MFNFQITSNLSHYDAESLKITGLCEKKNTSREQRNKIHCVKKNHTKKVWTPLLIILDLGGPIYWEESCHTMYFLKMAVFSIPRVI